ncbi:YidC/Oxa1 family membrane protein insertase [Nocardioides panaciterrulae]|uniref:Membrane protein insertase YidC n=2 Tax=Nocardioides panaciterrulae TaxID=661492 RepID=A0A7Y9E2U3_9ACTN|nr:YidC/Oxa1 family membrane protein insertase [Nocardioides panaciterrulae]
MGNLGAIGHFIMTPLYYAISAVLVAWHSLLSLVLPADGGMSWVLSIIGLTLVIRAALIPLFVKQIKSSRNMQLIQPKVKELQKKYGHDREKLAQETMKLYKESGTNPFASCLPILIQMPIFLALFRLLDHAAKNQQGNGFLTDSLAKSFGDSEIFGVMKINATFVSPAGSVAVQVLAAFLVVAMTATTFTTQRQLMSKNMPSDAMSGPYAQQQKMLLYVLPVVFAVGGIAFPIGVLFYWTTSNLWTMGQQFYVIRNNPAPGTPAFTAKAERDRAKAARHDAPAAAEVVESEQPEQERRSAQRQQPRRQTRQQRRKSGGGRPTDQPNSEGEQQ